MSFAWNFTAFDSSYKSLCGDAIHMRLLILSVTLLAIASCKSGGRAPNSNSVAPSASRGDKTTGAQTSPQEPCLNLNIATADDLTKLPGIGEVMAKRIVDYRERHGRFRRPEEIIIIEGFSEKKYRTIAEIICIE
jgi:competence ComEA-like helix-hairpin-helix protein